MAEKAMLFTVALGIIGIMSVMGVPGIRRLLFIKPLFQRLKKIMPPMSETERAAIESGDVWWEGQLFQGTPDWEQWLAEKKPSLTHQERDFLNHEVEHLCALIDEWQVSETTRDLPPAVWDYLKQKKFFAMIIPKEYGGLAFSAVAHSTIVQKIATSSLTAAITTMVPNSLGPAELLIEYGTEDQKAYYLPRLASGEEIPCFALTSLEAGSDAGGMQDIGIVCRGIFEGQETVGLKLSWNKRYITLAPVATLLGLAVQVYDPEKLLGQKESLGITVCLLPTQYPGVEIGRRHFPLHQAFMNGPTEGKEVFIPLDWVIGGAANIGKGWQMLIERLSVGRGISLPALSTAFAKVCYRATGAYAAVRHQFNVPIGKFEGVEEALATIGGYTYLMETARLATLTALDKGLNPSIITAMAKYHITELGRIVINKAMDVQGGRGIMLGPHNYLSQCYESIPISITVEGANILTRNLMIFGQGAIRCHPYLQAEMQALSHPELSQGIVMLDKVFFKHGRYLICNFLKNLFHAFTAGKYCRVPEVGILKTFYKQLNRMSVALAWVGDMTLILLGGQLKRRERLSARLGDVLSYLYLASAVLKYHHQMTDSNTQVEQERYATWCLKTCLYHIQQAWFGFCDNFPNRWIGSLFKFFIFPWGKAYNLPTDIEDHQIAEIMMQSGIFREQVTKDAKLCSPEHDPVRWVEEAFQQMLQHKDVMRKIENAVRSGQISPILTRLQRLQAAFEYGIISEGELKALENFENVRTQALRVDDFGHTELSKE